MTEEKNAAGKPPLALQRRYAADAYGQSRQRRARVCLPVQPAWIVWALVAGAWAVALAWHVMLTGGN